MLALKLRYEQSLMANISGIEFMRIIYHTGGGVEIRRRVLDGGEFTNRYEVCQVNNLTEFESDDPQVVIEGPFGVVIRMSLVATQLKLAMTTPDRLVGFTRISLLATEDPNDHSVQILNRADTWIDLPREEFLVWIGRLSGLTMNAPLGAGVIERVIDCHKVNRSLILTHTRLQPPYARQACYSPMSDDYVIRGA